MADDEPTDDETEREAERLLKEAGPLHEQHRIFMAGVAMHRRVRAGEVADPVTVEDATISYDPSRGGTGVVIRDFLGREFLLEDWLGH